jgi:hypothetical protein
MHLISTWFKCYFTHMATDEFFERIDPELFDFAVAVEYHAPAERGRNHVWLGIRALAGERNARLGVEIVSAAHEQSQMSLGQPLRSLGAERPVNTAQALPNQIQESTALHSNTIRSITRAVSSENLGPTGSTPQRRQFNEENPPTDLDHAIQGPPNSAVSHALPTSDRAQNPMQQAYRRFRNFIRTITRQRRI